MVEGDTGAGAGVTAGAGTGAGAAAGFTLEHATKELASKRTRTEARRFMLVPQDVSPSFFPPWPFGLRDTSRGVGERGKRESLQVVVGEKVILLHYPPFSPKVKGWQGFRALFFELFSPGLISRAPRIQQVLQGQPFRPRVLQKGVSLLRILHLGARIHELERAHAPAEGPRMPNAASQRLVAARSCSR